MLSFLDRIRWGQTYDFLVSGSPPIFIRLMLLNALFMALYAVRRAAGAAPMSIAMALFTQLVVIGANLAVIYQREVTTYLGATLGRYFH